ncbi:hypothetical protein Xmir_04232 [Xenorhabdus miraniensis]|uniref:Uncharacterized protein n=1 Tax=Xenorhabdus miraniensis TaxID=351674 RepID=A0A2D0JJM1_9GAMM|nr:hypothetical protein Xmir_04232 [Xenorhabdus miraniensis]
MVGFECPMKVHLFIVAIAHKRVRARITANTYQEAIRQLQFKVEKVMGYQGQIVNYGATHV